MEPRVGIPAGLRVRLPQSMLAGSTVEANSVTLQLSVAIDSLR